MPANLFLACSWSSVVVTLAWDDGTSSWAGEASTGSAEPHDYRRSMTWE